jgi:hypothetical protein
LEWSDRIGVDWREVRKSNDSKSSRLVGGVPEDEKALSVGLKVKGTLAEDNMLKV